MGKNGHKPQVKDRIQDVKPAETRHAKPFLAQRDTRPEASPPQAKIRSYQFRSLLSSAGARGDGDFVAGDQVVDPGAPGIQPLMVYLPLVLRAR
jgi:hypothetical protein